MAVEVKEARVENITMRYLCFGKGDKDMVILPGLAVQSVLTSAEAIADAYGMFGKEFKVWLIDRRQNLPGVYTIDDMAEDTAKIMKSLGLKNVCLFGVSQGGMMAEIIAIRHPELVGKLILASSVSKFSAVGDHPVWENWVNLAKQGKIHELNMAFCEELYGPEVFAQFKDAILAAEKGITEEDLKRFVIMAGGTENFSVYDELNKITCPVLILGSEKDTVLDVRNMKETAEILGCEIFLYEGYSHAVYDLAPDFKDRIMSFFV
jgi:pimeloyl-ACP methyl ester carboxylesterase